MGETIAYLESPQNSIHFIRVMIQNNDETNGILACTKKRFQAGISNAAELEKLELKRLLLNNGCNLFSSCLHKIDGKRAFCPNLTGKLNVHFRAGASEVGSIRKQYSHFND